MSLLITNGKVFFENKLVEKNIFIEQGTIKKVTSGKITADKEINAKGKLIIPGAIDCHVHFREPGFTHKEDFLSGSMAAAAAGITSFLDMPNTHPSTTTVANLELKRQLAKKSIVNYGFNFGATLDNVDEINKAENVAAVKVYMDHTTGEMILEDKKALQAIFTANKAVMVHAESTNVKLAVELISKGNNALYICHTSSREELQYATTTPTDNKVYVEVTPHHLFLTQDTIKDLGTFAEMKPGLKTKEDSKALWEGIKAGTVHTIGTDHAPHTKEEKESTTYPFGVPGCETMLPLMLHAYNNNKITLQKIVELCCHNPASIFRMKNKGFIKEGYDADLTIIDPDLEKGVRAKDHFSKCKWSPFDGWKLKGWPVTTIVNGNIIFDNGNINKIPAKPIEYE